MVNRFCHRSAFAGPYDNKCVVLKGTERNKNQSNSMFLVQENIEHVSYPLANSTSSNTGFWRMPFLGLQHARELSLSQVCDGHSCIPASSWRASTSQLVNLSHLCHRQLSNTVSPKEDRKILRNLFACSDFVCSIAPLAGVRDVPPV